MAELSEERKRAWGITWEEAAERQKKYGRNVLASEKKAKPLKIFLGQIGRAHV